jgi:glyoxylase-like metal-dependent hydrolase (beta-lactamase superfamily II)
VRWSAHRPRHQGLAAGLPRYWNLLNGELERLGTTLDNVRALILTHGDTDHIGFVGRLFREKGIPACLHPADADRATLKETKIVSKIPLLVPVL